MMCSKSERFLAIVLISSWRASAFDSAVRCGAVHATADAHSCEDFLALELVQLRGALLEVEARLVTGASHVCGGVDIPRYAATTFVS